MADQTYLSKQKAAHRLDVSEKTIDRLRSSGALEWIHVGSRVRIPVARPSQPWPPGYREQMGSENPDETRAWIGAEVPPEQAREWIAARIPPIPADEPPEDASLPHCAACGRAIYPAPGAVGEKSPGPFGFDWHDFCAESYPFPDGGAISSTNGAAS